MLKKTITYTDYNGNERTEDFYFNLTKTEILEMELSEDGGLGAMLQKIVNEKNTAQILKYFKWIVMKAYGEKSPDGKHMMKSDAISEAFIQTPAYETLFMELVTDENAMTAFVNSIVPQVDTKSIENA